MKTVVKIKQNYKKITSLKTFAEKQANYWLGLCENNQGKKSIIKVLEANPKTAKYRQILNEARSLDFIKRIQSTSTFRIHFPELIRYETTADSVILERSYIFGRMMSKIQGNKMTALVINMIRELENISETAVLQCDYRKFPYKNRNHVTFMFPLLFLRIFIKDLNSSYEYLRLLIQFYKASIYCYLFKENYYLANGDLHPNNIIVSGENQLSVIDTERSMITEKDTDLAILARYLNPLISIDEMKFLLKTLLKTNLQKARFMRLTIYYGLHGLLTPSRRNEYQKTKKYLFNLKQLSI